MHDVPYVENYSPSPSISLFASMIKFPKDEKYPPYAELPCTDQDKAIIYEIISKVAEKGKITLLFTKGYYDELRSQIEHIHPLKFLSTIVTHPYLNSCLVEIFDDFFKRDGFMDGLGPRLSKEADIGKLGQYIEGFANEVGVPQEKILKYFRNHDWEGLTKFFID